MRYLEDYSLTEIGEELGVSPQAVMDLLRRTEKRLEYYENKLGLLKKHDNQQIILQDIINELKKPQYGMANQLESEILRLVRVNF